MPHAVSQFLANHPLIVFLITYYGCVNLVCFLLYGWDKAAARAQASRISEKTLHGWSFAGGAFGALCAQSFFRHKTQKAFFKWFGWFCFGLHAVLLSLIFACTGMISAQ